MPANLIPPSPPHTSAPITMSTAQQPDDLDESPLELPKTYTAQYLAEGAANIVYRIIAPPSTPGESELDEYGDDTPPPTEYSPPSTDPFEGTLLRLRKALPTTVPAVTSHASFLRTVSPLLPPAHVIPQRLIALPASFISDLNGALLAAEASNTRPAKRHGVYLADDTHGLCVKDMSARPGERLCEFKPKWLAPSPNAPPGSVRCRTCARGAREREGERERGREEGLDGAGREEEKSFCPLDLLSHDSATLRRVAACILRSDEEEPVARLAQWLGSNELLHTLRDLQARLDPRGVLGGDAADVDFRAAMTLRDCAVFVRFPAGTAELEVRIGDLDLKSALKAEYWRGNEAPLVCEGWYAGRGVDVGCGCVLGR